MVEFFCMELQEKAASDEQTFTHADVADIAIFASPMTLAGIGGATIDFREGRFKLDLPEDALAKGCACKEGGVCGCE